MKLNQLIHNETEIRKALKLSFNRQAKSKFDFSTKQLRSFYKAFNNSLLVIDETPYSWRVKTKSFGTVDISKEYSIRNGLFIQYVDSWYLNEYFKGTVKTIASNPVR